MPPDVDEHTDIRCGRLVTVGGAATAVTVAGDLNSWRQRGPPATRPGPGTTVESEFRTSPGGTRFPASPHRE